MASRRTERACRRRRASLAADVATVFTVSLPWMATPNTRRYRHGPRSVHVTSTKSCTLTGALESIDIIFADRKATRIHRAERFICLTPCPRRSRIRGRRALSLRRRSSWQQPPDPSGLEFAAGGLCRFAGGLLVSSLQIRKCLYHLAQDLLSL